MSIQSHVVQLHDSSIHAAARVELWRVLGIEGRLYPTKVAAEVAARVVFPDEAPWSRNGRISYVAYVREEL